MKKIVLPMLAGETHYLNVSGDFIRQIKGGAVSVAIDDGDALDFCVGIALQIKAGFNRVSVTSVYAQSIALVIGYGGLIDERSCDVGRGMTLGVESCLGSGFVVATSLAGQFSSVMLGNPLNSGVNVLVRAVSFACGSNSQQTMMTGGLLSGVVGMAVIANAVANARLGGPLPKAQVWGGNPAAPVGGMVFPTGISSDRRVLVTPIIVPQGYGVQFGLVSNNTSLLNTTFEWTEEATPPQAAP